MTCFIVVVSAVCGLAAVTRGAAIIDGDGSFNASDTGGTLEEIGQLRSNLLLLQELQEQEDKERALEEGERDEESANDRFKRLIGLSTQCSCSVLSAIAEKISQFERDVDALTDVEKKLHLISAALKQLGLWINAIQTGPPGPAGNPGVHGDVGHSGGDGPAGANTIMRNDRGVPGPPGPMGSRGIFGTKGERGDCISGEKGLRGERGENGYSAPGTVGAPGDAGEPGIPASVGYPSGGIYGTGGAGGSYGGAGGGSTGGGGGSYGGAGSTGGSGGITGDIFGTAWPLIG